MAEIVEGVALELLVEIAKAEQWSAGAGSGTAERWNKTRKEILDAYAECLSAAKGNRRITS